MDSSTAAKKRLSIFLSLPAAIAAAAANGLLREKKKQNKKTPLDKYILPNMVAWLCVEEYSTGTNIVIVFFFKKNKLKGCLRFLERIH